eukprot:6473615-Amphidinium_carterae.2
MVPQLVTGFSFSAFPVAAQHHITNFAKNSWPKIMGVVKRGSDDVPDEVQKMTLDYLATTLQGDPKHASLMLHAQCFFAQSLWSMIGRCVRLSPRLATWTCCCPKKSPPVDVKLALLAQCACPCMVELGSSRHVGVECYTELWKVVLAPAWQVATYMSRNLGGSHSPAKVAKFLAGLQMEGVQEMAKEVCVVTATVGLGDLLYIPPGFVFAEEVGKQDVIGMKWCTSRARSSRFIPEAAFQVGHVLLLTPEDGYNCYMTCFVIGGIGATIAELLQSKGLSLPAEMAEQLRTTYEVELAPYLTHPADKAPEPKAVVVVSLGGASLSGHSASAMPAVDVANHLRELGSLSEQTGLLGDEKDHRLLPRLDVLTWLTSKT